MSVKFVPYSISFYRTWKNINSEKLIQNDIEWIYLISYNILSFCYSIKNAMCSHLDSFLSLRKP